MEVKSGYKQTEVGAIPEDWEVKFLPDVCLFRGGKAHEQYISDLGRFVCVNSKFISTGGAVRKYSTVNFCRAKRNDVLMVMSDLPNGRALAKAFLADRDDLYAVNQRVCALTPFSDSPRFLFYALDRNPYFLRFDDGVNQTHLLNRVFEKCPLPLPPTKAEQEAIAEALSAADVLIESLEQLLDKKRQLKQGAMQELLTGKKRLPGFIGEWEVKRLGDCFALLSNRNTELNDNVVTISAQHGFLRQEEYFKKRVASATLENYYLLETGQFAYNRSYSNGYPFGAIKRLTGFEKGVVTTLYICFALKREAESDPTFYEHYFEAGLLNDGLSTVTNEGGRVHGLLNISKADFLSCEIKRPPLAEQTAIAAILSDMDAELKALEVKHDKARLVKQGMMQELLTGRIRLV